MCGNALLRRDGKVGWYYRYRSTFEVLNPYSNLRKLLRLGFAHEECDLLFPTCNQDTRINHVELSSWSSSRAIKASGQVLLNCL